MGQSSAEGVSDSQLHWREVVAIGRRALALCLSTSPWLFGAITVGSIAGAFVPAALAGMAGYIVTQVESLLKAGVSDLTTLFPSLILILIILLFNGIVQAINSYSESMLAARMDLRITKELASHASTLDLAFFDLPENHDILSRGFQYAGRDFLSFVLGIIRMGAEAVQFATLFGVMMWIQPLVTPLLAVLVAPMIAFRWRISKMQYKINIAKTSKMRLRNYYAGELTRREALPIVKLFNLSPILLKRFEKLSWNLIELDRRLFRRLGIGQAIGTTAFAMAFIVAAAWAAQSALAGTLALGLLVTYLTCAERLRSSLVRITKAASETFKNILFVQNLHDFIDAKPSIRSDVGLCPDRTRGHIELRNVSFTYPGATAPTIRKIDLEILPGQTVALVGANGAGKTTLAHLIARLYDVDGGSVLLDGVDVRDLSARWYYDQIAYVGQFPIRFEVTAADNIAFGDWKRLGGNRAGIEKIVAEAGIAPIIEGMPHGLDTVLGRRFGEYDLSGGQWQRLAVTRALTKDAPILILDEPTANMDARSEYELFTTLRGLAKDKTAVIISHRFATVRSADRIVVMDEGEIVELGSHDELMQLGGVYAGLYRIQQKALNG